MAPPFASMPTIPHCSTVCTSDMISDITLPFHWRGLVARCAAVFPFLLPTASCMDREAACTHGVYSIPLQHVAKRWRRPMRRQCMEAPVVACGPSS
jgi:hypothetical protein